MAATRKTPRKEAILRLLEADYESLSIGGKYTLASDIGRPPFNAGRIAKLCDWFSGADVDPYGEEPTASVVQSFARTLRGMAKEGLVVSVRHKTLTRNAIIASQRDFDCDIPMMQTCYYSAKAMVCNVEAEEAEEAHRKWCKETPEGRAYEKARTDSLLDGLFGARPAQPTAAQLPGDVIDGCITEVSRENDTTSETTAGPKYIPF